LSPRFIKSAAGAKDFPADSGSEVAVVGRSNSGKSSAINRLTRSTKLARVSKTPGRTQLINFFELEPERRLVDLPGYGFAKVPESVRQGWRVLVSSYLDDRSSLRGLIITVDIRRGFQALDSDMLAWGASLRLPMLVLLSKADKLSREAGRRQQRSMSPAAPPGTRLELFSSISGQGADEGRGWIDAVLNLTTAEQ
jgi:GTP-binding protein